MSDASPDPVLEACAAAANACLAQLNVAADAWAEHPAAMSDAVRAAESARDRIDSYVAIIRKELPSHARKARLAFELAERASAALRAVWALPPASADEDAECAALEEVDRRLSALQRASDALVH